MLILPQKRFELADDLMSSASSDEGLVMSKQRRMMSNVVFAKLWLKKSPELISFGRKRLLFIFVWEIMLYSYNIVRLSHGSGNNSRNIKSIQFLKQNKLS